MVNEFGNTLDAILSKREMSQNKMCAQIGIADTAMSFYRNGQREVPVDTLGKIINGLNLNKTDESILIYDAARDMRLLKHDSVKMSVMQRDTIIRLMFSIHELPEDKVLAIRKLLK